MRTNCLTFTCNRASIARAKVTLVGGAGGIGSCVAFNLLLIGGFDVVLVDPRADMVASHLMDLEQVLEQGVAGGVREGDGRDLIDADVVVLSGGVPLTVNTSRMVYLDDNAAIVAETVDALPDGWGGLAILVTNPVDPLCTWALPRSRLERERLLGYTLNDTLRLRTGIARALGGPPGGVEAWVIGEHGDGAVPLFDRVAVDGAHMRLTAAQRAQAEAFLRGWYVRHVALDSGRSSTWTSGLGVARMIQAIASDSGELFPASILLRGEYGIDGVCLSVPVSVGAAGARRIHEWELSRSEQAALTASADLVRGAAANISGVSA
jgi:malate dehydrogenase